MILVDDESTEGFALTIIITAILEDIRKFYICLKLKFAPREPLFHIYYSKYCFSQPFTLNPQHLVRIQLTIW